MSASTAKQSLIHIAFNCPHSTLHYRRSWAYSLPLDPVDLRQFKTLVNQALQQAAESVHQVVVRLNAEPEQLHQ